MYKSYLFLRKYSYLSSIHLIHFFSIKLLFFSELKFSQSIFKKKNIRPELCEKVKNAHVIVADRPIYIPKNSNGSSESSNYIESLFFLNEYRYTEIGKSRKSDGLKTKLYFNNKEIEEHVITCEYGELQKTSIYLTKIFRGEHFFLFGKTEKTDKLPKLLAVVGKYFELEPVNYGRRLSIVDMILKYNESKYYKKIFNRNMFLN